MKHKQAHDIAIHHLGTALYSMRHTGCEGDDLWAVTGMAPNGCTSTVSGGTIEFCAASVAANLLTLGWTPTHARLEWRSVKWQHFLHFRLDNLDKQVAAASQFGDGSWRLYCRGDTPAVATREQAAATIAAWHAATLPSLHLPPFPTDDK